MKKITTTLVTILLLFILLISCKNESYHIHEFSSDWIETNNGRYKECSICKYRLIEDTITMTLEEFNNAESIPDWVNNVIVENIELTLNKEDRTIIGNKNIADFYSYKKTNELKEEEKENVIGTNSDLSILTTNKKGFTLILKGGTVKGLSVDSPVYDKQGENGIYLYVPDASTVIFDEVTFKDATLFILGQWQQIYAEGYNPEVKYPHIIAKIVLENCKFDKSGLFQNGQFAKELLIEKCHFTEIENPEYWSNCNPIWFKNLGQENKGWMVDKATSNATVNGCTFETSRPIKLIEETIEGSKITITNNTFIMKQHDLDSDPIYNAKKDKRNDVIMFSTGNGNLDDVLIENNVVSGDATAFLTFFNPPQITMKEGAKFIVKNNQYPETIKDCVEWKKDTILEPDFVQFI